MVHIAYRCISLYTLAMPFHIACVNRAPDRLSGVHNHPAGRRVNLTLARSGESSSVNASRKSGFASVGQRPAPILSRGGPFDS